jgi:hypothetical protein
LRLDVNLDHREHLGTGAAPLKQNKILESRIASNKFRARVRPESRARIETKKRPESQARLQMQMKPVEKSAGFFLAQIRSSQDSREAV